MSMFKLLVVLLLCCALSCCALILGLILQSQHRKSILWCSASLGRSLPGGNASARCLLSAGALKSGCSLCATGHQFDLCLSLQIVSDLVCHLRRHCEVLTAERVPNARAAVHRQELQRHWGQRVRMAGALQHHRLHRLPHVGVLRWYRGSRWQTGAQPFFFFFC